MRVKIQITLILGLLIASFQLMAQPVIVDKIVGVVGKNQILYSDVEDQYIQMIMNGVKPLPSKCEIFEDIMMQKLLVNQADVDSILVDEPQVEIELADRINYFIRQIGTEEKLIEHFGKSIYEIKDDMRDAVREQMLMQKMRMEITSDMGVTPSEVRDFYKELPKDSIPEINGKVEINQLLLYPPKNEESIFEVREKLLALRERIVNGEKFATLAVLYSEGPSASRGGDIGWAARGELDPAYTKAAFALKKGQVSKIVESSFGYHIIQLVDRQEERIHTRHILMQPKVDIKTKEELSLRMDSILTLVRIDTFTFEEAAVRFSDDENTRMNGGLLVNPYTNNTSFELDQFDTKEHYIIRKLKVGEISEAYESVDENGKYVYKVIRLKSKTEPHKATMRQDYELLKQMATQAKQDEIVDKWIQEKITSTYLRISDPYKACTFRLKGWKGIQ